MKTLEFEINNFVMDRLEDAEKIAIKKNEYQTLSDKILYLMNEIEELLPKEKKHLIGDLESHNSSQATLVEAEMYKQGFKDGFKLNDFLEI